MQDQETDLGFLANTSKFTDPFLLPSNYHVPTSLESALDFCFFLYHLNPQYRMASRRVVSHFITDIDFAGDKTGDADERDDLYDYLKEELDVFGAIGAIGEEWACFAGETKMNTRDGVFEIRDLVGRRVDVLSRGGVYRPADFKSYGVQPLMEVEFCDKRKVYATPEHKWIVRNGAGKTVTLTTAELTKTHRIERTVAPRPPKNEDYREGVRHGFVFGDGSLYSKNKRTGEYAGSAAQFVGAKDQALSPFFEGCGNPRRVRADRADTTRISGLSNTFKSLPARTASASYWYGFLSGFLAADGTVDIYGCAMLTQIKKETLDAVVEQLPRIGMVAGPVRAQRRITDLRKYNGNPTAVYDSTIHFVTLLKRFMLPDDFIIPAHRENFVKKFKGGNYGRYMRIKAVRKTDRVEEVFCCEEMETHTLVVENAILSKNCYGNGFGRIHFPFDRYLVDTCEGRYRQYALGMFGNDAHYHWEDMTYEVPDPVALSKNKRGRKDTLAEVEKVKLSFWDRKSRDWDRIRLLKVDPRRMYLQSSLISGECRYIYRFEQWFVQQIKDSRLWQVNETPIEMLRAIKENQDFLFDHDQIFHLKGPVISGVSNNGWGLPETLVNYRNLHQLQVYRRIDESVGLDYMLPFRMFSPNWGDKIGDATVNTLLGHWQSQLQDLIAKRRKDQTSMFALPFPVKYDEFGGNGKALTPFEMVEFQTNNMLDSMGYPAELFKGSLDVQQIPTTLRLFENTFHFLHRGFEQYIKWVTRRVRDYQKREQLGVSLQLPSMADDLEERNTYLQLAAGGEVSRAKAYRPFGIDDPVAEAKARIAEDIEIQEAQAKAQQDAQKKMTAGNLSDVVNSQAQQQQQGGAGPVPQGAEGGQTPLDTQGKAEDQANQWMQIQNVGERRKAMQQVEASNPQLYAVAKDIMDKKRRQGESQGRQQVNQQAAQPGGGGQAPPPQ